MNHQEPTDPAWELLKQAKEVEPSLFFVRNVVREVRLLQMIPAGIWSRVRSAFGHHGFLTASAACAVATMGLVALPSQIVPVVVSLALFVVVAPPPATTILPAS